MVAIKILPPFSEKDVIRFWRKVDKTKGQGPRGTCWTRRSYTDTEGYSHFYYAGSEFLAHRVAYFFETGDNPRTLDVLHKCHFSGCIRPKHLYTGTHQQNMDDRGNAGRQVTMHGIDHPVAKLTEADVIEIRACFKRGIYTKADLARAYNVSHRLIRNIINRTAWKHI